MENTLKEQKELIELVADSLEKASNLVTSCYNLWEVEMRNQSRKQMLLNFSRITDAARLAQNMLNDIIYLSKNGILK